MNSDVQIDLQTLQILLEARGITLEPKPDGKLKINAQTTLEPELLEAIKAHKSALLEMCQYLEQQAKASPLFAWFFASTEGILEEALTRKNHTFYGVWIAPDFLAYRTSPTRITTQTQLQALLEEMQRQAPADALRLEIRDSQDSLLASQTLEPTSNGFGSLLEFATLEEKAAHAKQHQAALRKALSDMGVLRLKINPTPVGNCFSVALQGETSNGTAFSVISESNDQTQALEQTMLQAAQHERQGLAQPKVTA